MVKPSEALVASHSSISSATVLAVPTMARPPKPPIRCASWRTVRFSRLPSAMARSRPLTEALLSGMSSGSGLSWSNFEASWPSAIDSDAIALA